MPCINVNNMEVSRRMLDMTEKQWALRAGTALGRIVDATVGDPVILDNIEEKIDGANLGI